MKRYMFTCRPDGIFIIHIGKLWEKLILAARVIVCIDQGVDIYVTSSSFHGRRPASKISSYLGTSVNCDRFAPGTFTKSTAEPRLLICMDPRDDMQAVNESNKCNVPVIAFANSHSSLKYVDIAINIDWAEDEPEKQQEQPREEEQPMQGGWDAATPTNDSQQ